MLKARKVKTHEFDKKKFSQATVSEGQKSKQNLPKHWETANNKKGTKISSPHLGN